MKIELGNNTAVEGFYDGGVLKYRPIVGEQVTTFVLPDDDDDVAGAVSTVIGTIDRHMVGNPLWVECDHPGVLAMLLGYWGIPTKHNKRPVRWGDGSTTARLTLAVVAPTEE